MAEIIRHQYQFKRGTADRWAQLNPILAQGEPGFVYDINKLKIGDGFTPWNALPYIDEASPLETGVYNAPTHEHFPEVGKSYIIYKAEQEAKLYQWNSDLNKYELLTTGLEDITEINGGGAPTPEELGVEENG